MQKRRVDMLEELLAKLNPHFYMVDCRQIMIESADCVSTLRDLNEEKLQVC